MGWLSRPQATLGHSWLKVPKTPEFLAFCEEQWTYVRQPRFYGDEERTVRLYFVKEKEIWVPTGLFNLLPAETQQTIKDAYMVQDVRTYPPLRPANLDALPLRDYQREAVTKLLGARRGLLGAPTGSGKTYVIAALTTVLPLPILVATHSVSIATQLKSMVEELIKEKVGFVGAGTTDIQPVTVALFQSLWSKRQSLLNNYLSHIRSIIVDECHHVAARTFFRTIQFCGKAGYRFGVSATPYRTDKEETWWLFAALGPHVHTISRQPLTDQGYLAPPLVVMLRIPFLMFIKTESWQELYDACIVSNNYRNNAIVTLIKHGMTPCLILVWSVKHGYILLEKLRQEGIAATFIYGTASKEEREAAKRAILDGTIQVLIASDIFKEGVDIPNLPYLINAAAMKSDVATIQRVGRALRPKPDGGPAIIIDFFDTDPQIIHHSRKRKSALTKEFGAVVVKDKIQEVIWYARWQRNVAFSKALGQNQE